MEVKAVEANLSQDRWDRRWVLVDEDTGEIVDDAQGYGYKTPQKAYASWRYKSRSPAQKAKEAATKKAVRKFIAERQDVEEALTELSWDIAHGDYGPGAHLTPKMVDETLQELGVRDLPFTARDLLKYW